MQIGGYSIEIDADPDRVLPFYRCLDVFDNRGMDNEHPIAHLERFVLYLEQSPRGFSVICLETILEEDDVIEQPRSLSEDELADFPGLLALRNPRILTFFNTAIRQPSFRVNPLTGEVDDTPSDYLDALEYAKDAVARCKSAGLVVPAGLMQRLKALFQA